jgi:hypothetical protein
MAIKLPCYLQQHNSNVDLFDSTGEYIGTFKDWQQAEQVLFLLNESQPLISELENKVADNVIEVEELNTKISDLEDDISKLQSR